MVANRTLAIGASHVNSLPGKIDIFQEVSNAFQPRLDLSHRTSSGYHRQQHVQVSLKLVND